jgi:hypothetical protein
MGLCDLQCNQVKISEGFPALVAQRLFPKISDLHLLYPRQSRQTATTIFAMTCLGFQMGSLGECLRKSGLVLKERLQSLDFDLMRVFTIFIFFIFIYAASDFVECDKSKYVTSTDVGKVGFSRERENPKKLN